MYPIQYYPITIQYNNYAAGMWSSMRSVWRLWKRWNLSVRCRMVWKCVHDSEMQERLLRPWCLRQSCEWIQPHVRLPRQVCSFFLHSSFFFLRSSFFVLVCILYFWKLLETNNRFFVFLYICIYLYFAATTARTASTKPVQGMFFLFFSSFSSSTHSLVL